MDNEYFQLLDYFVNQPYGIVDWIEMPSELSSLCLDACGEGYIESYCETEAYYITERGKVEWERLKAN